MDDNTNNGITNGINNNPRRVSTVLILFILAIQFSIYTHYLTFTNDVKSDSNSNVNMGQRTSNRMGMTVYSDAKYLIGAYEEMNKSVNQSDVNSLLTTIYHDLYIAHNPINMRDYLKDSNSDEYNIRNSQLNRLLHPHRFNNELATMFISYGSDISWANSFLSKYIGYREPELIDVGNEDGSTIGERENIQMLRDKYIKELLNERNSNRIAFLKRFKSNKDLLNSNSELHISDLLNLNHLNSKKLVDFLHNTRFQRLIMSTYELRMEAMRRVTTFLYGNESKIPFVMSPETNNWESGEQCTFFYIYLLVAYPEYRQLYESNDCKKERKCIFISKRLEYFFQKFVEQIEPLKDVKQTPNYYKITIFFSVKHERIMYHVVTFSKLWNLVMNRLDIEKLDWLEICYKVVPMNNTGKNETPSISVTKYFTNTREPIETWDLEVPNVNAAVAQVVYSWIKANLSLT